MRVAILGSGSLGSLYAALLSRVDGVEMLIHGRGTHGAHMAAEGLHLEGESEHFVSNADVFFSKKIKGTSDRSKINLMSSILTLLKKRNRNQFLIELIF